MFDGFNIVDGAAAIIVLIGILGGLRRGLSGELARVIAAGVALYVAARYAEPMAAWIMDRRPMSYEKGYVLAFCSVLIAAFILTWLLRAVLRNLMLFAFKGNIERVGGALCGLLRSCMIVSFFVLLISLAPAGEYRGLVVDRSYIGPIICRTLRPMYEELREKTPELPLPAVPDDTGAAASTNSHSGVTVTDERMPDSK